MVSILPGQQEFHRTEHQEEEICYVTRGKGQIVIAEKAYDIEEGSAIFIPSMANHRLINLGEGNLEMICILNTVKGGFFDGGFGKLFTESGWKWVE
jgi:mannose-6-phosphate isomerase-like protein (cupin superfamily)